MSPKPEMQDRWREVYAAAEERGGERVLVGAMLERLDLTPHDEGCAIDGARRAFDLFAQAAARVGADRVPA